MEGAISLRERYEEFYGTNFEDAVKNNPYDEDEIPWSVYDDVSTPEIIVNHQPPRKNAGEGNSRS